MLSCILHDFKWFLFHSDIPGLKCEARCWRILGVQSIGLQTFSFFFFFVIDDCFRFSLNFLLIYHRQPFFALFNPILLYSGTEALGLKWGVLSLWCLCDLKIIALHWHFPKYPPEMGWLLSWLCHCGRCWFAELLNSLLTFKLQKLVDANSCGTFRVSTDAFLLPHFVLN